MTAEFIYTYIVPIIKFIIVVTMAYIVGTDRIKFFDDNNKNKRKYKRK